MRNSLEKGGVICTKTNNQRWRQKRLAAEKLSTHLRARVEMLEAMATQPPDEYSSERGNTWQRAAKSIGQAADERLPEETA